MPVGKDRSQGQDSQKAKRKGKKDPMNPDLKGSATRVSTRRGTTLLLLDSRCNDGILVAAESLRNQKVGSRGLSTVLDYP